MDDEDLAAQEEENLERGAPGEDDEEEEEEEIDDDEEHMVISADPGLCQPTDGKDLKRKYFHLTFGLTIFFLFQNRCNSRIFPYQQVNIIFLHSFFHLPHDLVD